MEKKIIEEVRKFNRFYTAVLGLVDSRILESKYTLAEARALYEVAKGGGITASDIIRSTGTDKGYLSRTLKRFEKDKLIRRVQSGVDGRAYHLVITDKGRKEFGVIDRASKLQLNKLISPLSETERKTLLKNMKEIREVFSGGRRGGKEDSEKLSRNAHINSAENISIRHTLKPGDTGYIVNMHGRLYSKEYGYGIEFENYVALGMEEFYGSYDASRDRVWICEDGSGGGSDRRIIGFLLGMHRQGGANQFRYFLIEPEYRGIGLGKKLMKEYVKWIKSKGYRSSYLWTTSELKAAAYLYESFGFVLTEEKKSTRFGKRVTEQKYVLNL